MMHAWITDASASSISMARAQKERAVRAERLAQRNTNKKGDWEQKAKVCVAIAIISGAQLSRGDWKKGVKIGTVWFNLVVCVLHVHVLLCCSCDSVMHICRMLLVWSSRSMPMTSSTGKLDARGSASTSGMKVENSVAAHCLTMVRTHCLLVQC